MSVITKDQLAQLIPGNPYLNQWCEALNEILPEYGIDTPQRVAAFIAQCAHESGGFKFLKENLNYRAASLRKTFPKYFPDDAIAAAYANKPQMIANRVYANRMGNGPEESGDGFRYCGRGLIQLTGKNNLNKWADTGDIKELTRRINGGYIGLEDRIKHYNHALHILGE